MTKDFLGPTLGCRQPCFLFGAIASFVVLVGLSFFVVILGHWMYYRLEMLTSLELWAGSCQYWRINLSVFFFGPLLLSVCSLALVYLSTYKEEGFIFGKAQLLACRPIVFYGVCVLWLVALSSHSTYFADAFWLLAWSTLDVWKANVFLDAFYRATGKSAAQ